MLRRVVTVSLMFAWMFVGSTGVLAQTIQESYTLPAPVDATQTTNGALGTPFGPYSATGGYTLGQIRLSGSFEEINGTTNDFASENRIRIIAPSGAFADVQLTTVSGYTGVFNFSNVVVGNFSGIDPAASGGQWNFRYFNTIDDTPAGGVPDARLLTFTADFYDLVPPTAIDLGTIYGDESTYTIPSATATNNHTAGQIRWYKFTITEEVSDATGFYLDIDSNGTGITDSEIGLYNSTGTLVGTDDDDGPGNHSALSFGRTALGGRSAIGGGAAPNGRDGALPAGTYYLAIAQFNSIFTNGFTVTTNGTGTGDLTVNLRTNIVPLSVPEPTSLALAGMGLGSMIRSRRRKARQAAKAKATAAAAPQQVSKCRTGKRTRSRFTAVLKERLGR
jgi:hypothetical protein